MASKKAKKASAIGRKYDTLLEVYFDGQDMLRKMRSAPGESIIRIRTWDYFLRTRIAVDRLEDLLDEKEGNLDKVQMLFADMEERRKREHVERAGARRRL